jgi:hypothetical protein
LRQLADRYSTPKDAVTSVAALRNNSRASDGARSLTCSLADVNLAPGGILHLPRLRFTRREASAILAVTPAGMGNEAVDFDASRDLAIQGELANYRNRPLCHACSAFTLQGNWK